MERKTKNKYTKVLKEEANKTEKFLVRGDRGRERGEESGERGNWENQYQE